MNDAVYFMIFVAFCVLRYPTIFSHCRNSTPDLWHKEDLMGHEANKSPKSLENIGNYF